jgi:hypothetical protein
MVLQLSQGFGDTVVLNMICVIGLVEITAIWIKQTCDLDHA